MAKLKVFRTTIGFHDAYVAAPSRAAALRAWGADTDLFAMEAAEEVGEPALMKRALADPGVVIKQARGTAAEHLAADDTKVKSGPSAPAKAKTQKPKPLPNRLKLEAVEMRLADAQSRFDRAKKELDDEAARLVARRRAMEHEHQTRIKGLQDDRDQEERTYRLAMDRWREQSD